MDKSWKNGPINTHIPTTQIRHILIFYRCLVLSLCLCVCWRFEVICRYDTSEYFSTKLLKISIFSHIIIISLSHQRKLTIPWCQLIYSPYSIFPKRVFYSCFCFFVWTRSSQGLCIAFCSCSSSVGFIL